MERLIEFVLERWDRVALAGFTVGLAIYGLMKTLTL